ncbi:MAG: tyrosine-type recombinase/integrase [Actinomycetota bacterium]|nr:tyrosine-type recombinase/integrase [Actinomycetota bacterium]
METVLLNAAGHRRSPATMPGYHRGRPPRNKGEEYPADPPTVEEIVAVMRAVGDRRDGHRLRALIVLLWRAGLRISEALALQESDLDRGRGAVLVRRGKGGLCRIRHRRPYVASRTMSRVVLAVSRRRSVLLR